MHDTQKIIFASLMCHGRFQYRPAVYGFLHNLPVIFLHAEKDTKKAELKNSAFFNIYINEKTILQDQKTSRKGRLFPLVIFQLESVYQFQ